MSEKPQPKLYTWKTWMMMVPALLVGAGLQPWREYQKAGEVTTVTLVITAIVFFVGLSIMFAVSWWGNRPEPKG